jgi:hypothetical protein
MFFWFLLGNFELLLVELLSIIIVALKNTVGNRKGEVFLFKFLHPLSVFRPMHIRNTRFNYNESDYSLMGAEWKELEGQYYSIVASSIHLYAFINFHLTVILVQHCILAQLWEKSPRLPPLSVSKSTFPELSSETPTDLTWRPQSYLTHSTDLIQANPSQVPCSNCKLRTFTS